MNASGHRQIGFLSGAGTALAIGLPGWQALAAGGIATITAGGRLSPDMDQTGLYRLLLPKKLEGHRRLTHWPMWALWTALALGAISATATPWWLGPAWALLIGWTSHLAVDFIFGAASRYRAAGIPMTPLGGHRGLFGKRYGLRSNGTIAKLLTRTILPLLICAMVAVCLSRVA